jgi:HK97 family phage prohead protease
MDDPAICQAYCLIKAADLALSDAMKSLGLSDPDDEMIEDEMPAEAPAEMGMYSSQVRAAADEVKTGSFVSWNSSGGKAQGKVVKVVSSGTATSSDGYEMEATSDVPVFEVQIYEPKDNGFVSTETVVVHKAEALTIIAALPEPRSEDIDMELRKSRIASAERFEMSTEIRAMNSGNGELRIGGYAAQFNKEATGLSFREMIAPGAFKRTLQSGEPVYLLVNHDTNGIPLASTSGGTLNLSEDEIGLRMEADLDPANPKAQELFSAISRGDIAKMSFAFTVAPNGSTREAGLRTLEDVNLFEVSAVTWPAYNDTALGLRTLEDGEQEALELRKRLLELKQKFTK